MCRSLSSHIRIHLPNVANEQAVLTVDEMTGKASIENLVEQSEVVKVNETVVAHSRPVELQSGDKVQVSERFFIFEYPSSSQNVKLSATPKAKTPVKKSPAKSSPSKRSVAQKGTPAKSKLSQFVVSADEVAASASPIAAEVKSMEVDESSVPVISCVIAPSETEQIPSASTPVESVATVSEYVHAELVLANAVEELVKSPRALAVREEEGSRACTPVYSEANAPSAAQLLFSPRKTPGSSAKKSAKKPAPTDSMFSPRKQIKTKTPGSARPSMGRVAEQLLEDATVDAIMANLQSFEQSASQNAGPVDITSALFSPPRKVVSRKSTPGSAKSASSINVARKLRALASESNEPPRVHEPIPFMHNVNSISYEPAETPAITIAPIENVATPSKKVMFGPALSPELFDKDQPSNLPVKRGTPIKLDGSIVQRKAPTSAFKAMQKKLDDSVHILRSAPAKPIKATEDIKIRPLELPTLRIVDQQEKVEIASVPAETSPVPDVFAEGLSSTIVKTSIKPAVYDNMVGVKEMMQTPKQVEMRGLDALKIMVKTPKDIPQVDLEESKEMFKTPALKPATPKTKKSKTPTTISKKLVDVKASAEEKEANFVGVKQMMKTPKQDTDDMTGIEDAQMMWKTPAIASDMINPATPNKRLSSHLGRAIDVPSQHEIHTLSSQVDVEVPQSPLDVQEPEQPVSDKIMMSLAEELCNEPVEESVIEKSQSMETAVTEEPAVPIVEEPFVAETEPVVEETYPIQEEMSIELEEMPEMQVKEPTPKKRPGRPKKVVAANEVSAEPTKKGSRKAKAAEPVEEQVVEEAPKRGRRAKVSEPEVVIEVQEEKPAVKRGRGRKPAAVVEEETVVVVEEEPVKSRRGRKPQKQEDTVMDTIEVEMQPEEPVIVTKKRGPRKTFEIETDPIEPAVVEEPKKKGRGKAAAPVVADEEAEEDKPAKKGRGRPKKISEPVEEPEKPSRSGRKAKQVETIDEIEVTEQDKENQPNKRSTKTVKSAESSVASTRKRKAASNEESEEVAVSTSNTRSVRRRK